MNVRMKQHILSPAVQNGEETDLRAKVAGIGGNGLKRSGAGGEQDFIQLRFVAQNQVVELFGDGEDHVVVVDGQQLSLPAFHPLRPRRILAFRTVTVATGVIGVSFFGAVAALLPIASQRGGTAGFDGMHQAELMERQAMLLAVPGAVSAEDAGHLEGGSGHGGLPGGGCRFFSLFAGRAESFERGCFLRTPRLLLDQIERTDDGGDGVRRNRGISGCGVDSAVTEKHLNGSRVGSVLEQVGGKTVAESVRRDAFFDTGHAAGVAADHRVLLG